MRTDIKETRTSGPIVWKRTDPKKILPRQFLKVGVYLTFTATAFCFPSRILFMTDSNLKILEFTLGMYPSTSPLLGISMVMVSFLPHILAIHTISISLYNKCFHHLLFLLGLTLSHESAKVLKKVWREPRPVGSFLSSYGLPSDHTMFMAFATAYAALFVYYKPAMRRRSKLVSVALMVIISALVGYSRIYLGVHSPKQVVVGALLGLIGGIIWFWISRYYLLPARSLANIFYKFHDRVHETILGTTHRKKI